MRHSSFKKRLHFVATVLVSVVALSGCGPQPWEYSSVEEVFAGQALPTTEMVGGLHVVKTSDAEPDKPVIVFIHGSPGSWDGWVHYLADTQLQQRAQLLAIDRPGFGRSVGPVVPELSGQASRLLPLLDTFPKGRRVILVGHSLGGPIALQVAAQYPERVSGLVLIAASLDPTLEEPRWYNHVANWRLLRWAIPDAMRRSNTEIMSLSTELEQQRAIWPQLLTPTVLIQGGEDSLVYPANADYAENRITDGLLRIVRMPQEGHFVIWENRAAVTTEIQRMLDRVAN